MVALASPLALDRIPPLADLETERAERHLQHFLRQAWHVVEPFTPFKPNWHIDLICEHLEAVERGEIRNLLVTMPPRMMKSLAISVFYPAWRWISAPGTRFLYASYSQDLATEHSLATRRVIESDWYQDRWGDRFQLAGDANLKTRFENDRRGARVSTSVGGVVTGRGGDRIVVDDAHNVRDAESDTIRESALQWYDQAMSTRLNDPKTGARIVVMQRLHEVDLAGHLLDQGGYCHLNLPMEYEPHAVQWTGFGQPDPRTVDGELLAPDRVGPEEVADLKVRLGSRAYAGQFQQRPAPAEGAILKRTWWQTWRSPLPPIEWMIQTWDTAFKTGQENDFSVCLTLALAGPNIYLLDCWRERVEFPDLERAVREQFTRWQPEEIVVEDKASGQSLLQQLRREARPDDPFPPPPLPLTAYTPDRDKLARVHATSPYLEAGRLFVPEDADWVDAFVHECAVFPGGQHDDQVDTLTMGVLKLAERLGLLRAVDPTLLAAFSGMPR